MAQIFTGFLWGFITDNRDPEKAGRVMVRVPGWFEPNHPEWAYPLGWPGGGGLDRGSQYPPTIGAQVALFFEHGDVEAPPAYLPGPYGYAENVINWASESEEISGRAYAGPGRLRQEIVDGKDPLKTTVIWEDDAFQVHIVNKGDDDPDGPDKRLVMTEKATGSGITINAADGGQNKSVTITLEANTSITIASNGTVDISGSSVQIQGRRVLRKRGVTTI